jgi:outer membrane protein
MNRSSILALSLLSLLTVASSAEAGDWYVHLGATHVNPTGNAGDLAGGALTARIDSDAQLGLVIGRRLNDRLSLELLAATPFRHTVSLNGAEALDFKHLPPTLSVVYAFAPEQRVNPFLGVGLNYTWTFGESERGPLAGTDVSLGNSFGLAAQAGLVFRVAERWQLVLDARWMDIDARVRVNGDDVGTAAVNPLVMGLHLAYTF